MSGQRVLITGINGFTGGHLQSELESQGYRVYGMVEANPNEYRFKANLADVSQLKGVLSELQPEYVIHLAGIAFVGHLDVLEFYKTNVVGTDNLLRACVESSSPVQKVILASSANVYGANPNSPLSETIIPEPVSHYAISKLAMEFAAKTYQRALPLIITRPFNYTGVGQSENFVIPKIVSHFRAREPVISLGNRMVRREYNDVRLVCRMYAGLLQSGLVGTTVNLCTGRAFSLDDILKTLYEITGHAIQVETDPALVRKNEIPELFGEPTLVSSVLDMASAETLTDTLRWMLNS